MGKASDESYGGGDHKLYHEIPDDPRDGGMEYPNYHVIRVPSGSNITLDDTSGHESITVQHATGSAVQFHPDGSVVFRSEKNSYEMVFGNKVIVINGDVALVVNGQLDTRVQGDYNLVVHGDYRVSVEGDHETVINGNDTKHVQKTREVTTQGAYTCLTNGAVEIASLAKMFLGSTKDLKLHSIDESIWMQGYKNIKGLAETEDIVYESGRDTHLFSDNEMKFYSNNSMSIRSDNELKISSKNRLTLKSSNYFAADGSKIFLNSGFAPVTGESDRTWPK